MTAGMLSSQMTPPAGEERRFEQWYDDGHIAHRLRLDGFSAASRYWQAPDADRAARHHLAIYELESLEALKNAEYNALKADPGAETDYFLSHVSGFTRFTAERIADMGDSAAHGQFLFAVAFAVPDEKADQFDDWYDAEHAPLLLRASDWLRVHRYRVLNGDGGPWTHFALHDSRRSMCCARRSASAPARARNGTPS